MAALVAEHFDHQVGGAVHHLRPVGEAGRRIDEAAEPDHAGDLVEIAERRLDLRQEIDGAGARGLLAVLDRDAAAELARGHHLAVGAEADLAGDREQLAAQHEGHVIGDRAARGRQHDPQLASFFRSFRPWRVLLLPRHRFLADRLGRAQAVLPASGRPLSCPYSCIFLWPARC